MSPPIFKHIALGFHPKNRGTFISGGVIVPDLYFIRPVFKIH
jgi:hypothetical protein